MSRPARSLLVFGIYTVLVGMALLLMPNAMLTLFGLPATSEIWIRVVGWLLGLLAFYYVVAARQDNTAFIRLTVYGRASVIVFYVAIAALGLAPPILISIGAIDLLGAIWTARALRTEGHQV